MRLAVMTNILPPYRIPLYARVAREPGVDVRVFCEGRAEFNRQWDVPGDLPFEQEVLTGRMTIPCLRSLGGSLGRWYMPVHLAFGVARGLEGFRPDVVISGQFGWTTLQALKYAGRNNIPLVVWSAGTSHSERNIGFVRKLIRRHICARASYFLAYGRESGAYLATLGVDGGRMTSGTQSVDNVFFARQADRHSPQIDRIRSKMGLRGSVLLFVGHLNRLKGVRQFLTALGRLHRDDPGRDWTTVMVGDGPGRSAVEAAAKAMPGRIVPAGFVQQEELPALYASADTLVFPTLQDAWGLVVNEALASGLPVLCSKYAGCATELITNPDAGEIFDPLDADGFVAALKRCIQRDPPCRSTRERARSAVAAHTIEASASAMMRAARKALEGKR